MTGRSNKLKNAALFIVDLIILWGVLTATIFIRYYWLRPDPDWSLIKLHFVPFSIIFILWLIVFGALGLYDLRFMKNGKRFLYRMLRAAAINILLTVFIFYALPFLAIEPRINLLIVAAFSTILIFAWRYLFNLLIVRNPNSRVIFFGVNKETVELADYLLKNPQLGQKPTAFVSNGESLSYPVLPLTNFNLQIQQLEHIVRDNNADTIVVSREIKENETLVKILFRVIPLGVAVLEFTAFYESLTGKAPLSLIKEIWFLENLVGIKKRVYEFFKRGLDIGAAVILGIPTGLLFPLVALAIKMDSKGPIFYKQKRMGRNGQEFWLIKFRSMVTGADQMSGFKKKGDDPRHTRIGIFLRKSYLDELPQIINIFKGEMSFVGPRPERPEYVRLLKQKIPFYEMRLIVPPGLTGWAQINMEDDASVEDAPEKVQYDLYYIKNRSSILDLLIILKTIFTLIRRKGR